MHTLVDFTSKDTISRLLRSVRVSSTVYCRSEFRAPWGFRVEARGVASFHLVATGSCWLEVSDGASPVRLLAGDLVLLPTGQAHEVKDSLASPATLLDDLLTLHPPVNGHLRTSGRGPASDIICGGFAVEDHQVSPLLASLPSLIHIAGEGGKPQIWVRETFDMLTREMACAGPGSETVIARLSDLLLAQALRFAWESSSHPTRSGLQPTNDPTIAEALRLIHDRAAQSLTVDDVAETVGLSRSALTARFRATTGETPGQYLTRWRMKQAAHYLRTGRDGLLQIAGRVGYDSEASLSKAFKRYFRVSPGAYRKSAQLTH
jgi:AraC-like DNA-binding protein